jgi:YD repeat-containing protein
MDMKLRKIIALLLVIATLAGFLPTQIIAAAAHTQYTYDRFGRQTSITDALGETESYVYDANGFMTSKTDRNGVTTSYTYDVLGNVLTESAGDITKTYTYDTLGNRASFTLEVGGVTKLSQNYICDVMNRLHEFYENNALTATCGRDTMDDRNGLDYANSAGLPDNCGYAGTTPSET